MNKLSIQKITPEAFLLNKPGVYNYTHYESGNYKKIKFFKDKAHFKFLSIFGKRTKFGSETTITSFDNAIRTVVGNNCSFGDFGFFKNVDFGKFCSFGLDCVFENCTFDGVATTKQNSKLMIVKNTKAGDKLYFYNFKTGLHIRANGILIPLESFIICNFSSQYYNITASPTEILKIIKEVKEEIKKDNDEILLKALKNRHKTEAEKPSPCFTSTSSQTTLENRGTTRFQNMYLFHNGELLKVTGHSSKGYILQDEAGNKYTADIVSSLRNVKKL